MSHILRESRARTRVGAGGGVTRARARGRMGAGAGGNGRAQQVCAPTAERRTGRPRFRTGLKRGYGGFWKVQVAAFERSENVAGGVARAGCRRQRGCRHSYAFGTPAHDTNALPRRRGGFAAQNFNGQACGLRQALDWGRRLGGIYGHACQPVRPPCRKKSRTNRVQCCWSTP